MVIYFVCPDLNPALRLFISFHLRPPPPLRWSQGHKMVILHPPPSRGVSFARTRVTHQQGKGEGPPQGPAAVLVQTIYSLPYKRPPRPCARHR